MLTFYFVCLMCPWANIVAYDSAKEDQNVSVAKFYNFIYNTYKRESPISYNSSSLPIECSMKLESVLGVDEKQQIFHIRARILFTWPDQYLYENAPWPDTNDIILPASLVWLPDVAITNSIHGLRSTDWEDLFPVRLGRANGSAEVSWEIRGIFDVACDIDIKWFPFDVQFCKVVLGTLISYESEIHYNLPSQRPPVTTDRGRKDANEFYVTNISSVIMQVTSDGRAYSVQQFWFVMVRCGLYYKVNLIGPCLILSVLSLVITLLPTENGEKMSLQVSILLAYSVFMLLLDGIIPRMPRIPILSVYLSTLMAGSVISLCVTIFVNIMSNKDDGHRMPAWARFLIFRVIGRLVCYQACSDCIKSKERRCQAKTNTTSVGPVAMKEKAKTRPNDHGNVEEFEDDHHIAHQKSNGDVISTNRADPQRDTTRHVRLIDQLSEMSVGIKHVGEILKEAAYRRNSHSGIDNEWKKEWVNGAKIIDRLFLILIWAEVITSTVFCLKILPDYFSGTHKVGN